MDRSLTCLKKIKIILNFIVYDEFIYIFCKANTLCLSLRMFTAFKVGFHILIFIVNCFSSLLLLNLFVT